MELPDQPLVERAQENDPDAFRQLVDKYKARIYYIAHRMMSNHSDADDVAQETFIRAYRGLKKFKGHSGFYTWIYRILVNCCMDALRKRKRGGMDFQLNEAMDSEAPAPGGGAAWKPTDALHGAELNELRSAVAEALKSLPPKHRMALMLHELEGMAHQDIAQIMGCSVGTARSRLHYARMKMQQKLRRFVE